MPRSTPTSAPSRTRRRGAAVRALAVVAFLAVVVTAGAPSFVRIRPGDTLSGIAQRQGTSVAVLRALNHLPGNATIYAGQLLQVPGSARTVTRTVERGYTVRSGDTLSGIAARFGVSVSSIRTRNRLHGPLLVGRRLAIPVHVTRSTGTTVSVPRSVSGSAAAHRALLQQRSVPSRRTVRHLVWTTARRHGVSPSLALAVAYQESGFQQRVVSGVDAVGVMQVLPSTARVLSQQSGRDLDVLDAADNVTAGVLLLRQLLRSTGSEKMALAGYYQGLGSIARQGLLPQTHQYIASVSALRPRFRNG